MMAISRLPLVFDLIIHFPHNIQIYGFGYLQMLNFEVCIYNLISYLTLACKLKPKNVFTKLNILLSIF